MRNKLTNVIQKCFVEKRGFILGELSVEQVFEGKSGE